jgi:hypothetical protein
LNYGAHSPRSYIVQTLTGETAEQALESVQPRYPVFLVPTVAASIEGWAEMVRGAG